MSLRDKVEHAIQNQPCTVKDLKARFGGDRGADRKVMEALDSLVHDAVICQRSFSSIVPTTKAAVRTIRIPPIISFENNCFFHSYLNIFPIFPRFSAAHSHLFFAVSAACAAYLRFYFLLFTI